MSMDSPVSNLDPIKERKDVPLQDRWDVESLYATWEDWERDFVLKVRPSQKPHWPELLHYKMKLSDEKLLKEFLDLYFLTDRQITKLYTFSHLKNDEDVAEEYARQANARMLASIYEYREELSWFEPELLSLTQDQIDYLLQSEVLKGYKNFLEKIIRFKPHTLSEEMESLMALSGRAMETPGKAFSIFNNADMKFPPVKDSLGNQHELTHGKYQLFMKSSDRELRKSAFCAMHNSYLQFENTLCELLQGQVQRHVFEKKVRGFASCLDAALFPHQIDEKVYTSLIAAATKNLPSLHKYFALRKRLLGYQDLHLYDMSVPLAPEAKISLDYPTAESLVIDSVKPLGLEYQEILRKGLTIERWVDRYENARKRSGAYSSGCYDSRPFILMNFNGTINDLFTLTHEAGHSMHSYFSHKQQPYPYASYSIFLAEVASTFHEELLFRYMFDRAQTKQERAFLVNQKIDDIRSTFFRQTMFAEFELKIHEFVEKDIPLTPALLKSEYRNLNLKYFGPEVEIDEDIDIEWSRIPHFYYNFYVYQYATGLSASYALAKNLFTEGESARKKYLDFISSGCSQYPLDTLCEAGIDMRGTGPIDALVKRFDELVSELENNLS